MAYRLLLLACCYLCASVAFAADSGIAEEQEQVVHQYIAAFNDHDTEAMLELVTDYVKWMTIDGSEITVETNNKDELRESMNQYFVSCSGCQSQVANIFGTGNRVTALEIATFESGHGQLQQQSLSVYEFTGMRISRVYYFPVEN